MIDKAQLQDMNADELRALALELMSEVQAQQHIVDRAEAALRFSDAKLAQLTHEMAVLKRWKFAARSEKLGHEQQSLLDETIDADLAAIELELGRLSPQPKTKDAPNKPRRTPLPANLPRVNVHHEPQSTLCGCGCELRRIGEDISQLYDIEREARDLSCENRLELRQRCARPVAEALHAWMVLQRARVNEGSSIAKALDYSLRRWAALTRYLDDPQLPVDNNWCENQIRPIAVSRGNWLFAGSARAGRRQAAVMSLIQSAKINGHYPYVYLKDILTRLPTQPASRLDELLPHLWQPQLQQ